MKFLFTPSKNPKDLLRRRECFFIIGIRPGAEFFFKCLGINALASVTVKRNKMDRKFEAHYAERVETKREYLLSP